MLTKDKAQEIIRQVTSYTDYYATVVIDSSSRETTRFANSQISQNVSIKDTTVSLTVHDGKKEASAATNVLSPEGLKELAQNAGAMLKIVPEGEFEAFPFSSEPVEDVDSDGKLARAYNIEARAGIIKEGLTRIKPQYTAAGALCLNKRAVAVGNSDTLRYAAFDQVEFNTVVTHDSGAAGGAEASFYSSGEVDGGLFEKAQETASRSHDPVSLELGPHTVVLSSQAVGDLMDFVGWMLCAKAVEDGASFAVGKLNSQVFGKNISLSDNSFEPGLRPLHFDMEGNPRRSLSLIENGVVSSLLYCNKTAARMDAKITGHAVSNKGHGGYPYNLVMEGGSQSLDEIIAGTDKGIFINEFHYTNLINPRTLQVTGLTRNGAYLINGGKLGPAIGTTRFTQGLITALSAVTAISKERKIISGSGLMPGMRIEGFCFTSNS